MSIKITLNEANANLKNLCSQVLDTGETVVISQPDGQNVVLISEAELNSLLEMYLLRSPANSARKANCYRTRENGSYTASKC